MKRLVFLVTFVASALIALIASAADAPRGGPEGYNWTGFYLGVQAGYGAGETDWEYALGGRADHGIDGWLAGPLAGYNYQFANKIVAGLETEFNFAEISGHTNCPNPVFTCSSKIDWLGSTRARAGYALDRFLPYFAVGVAYGQAKINTQFGTRFGGSNSYVGWTPGVGLEYAVSNHINVRAEYAYYDLGHTTVTVDNGLRVKTHLDVHAGKLGLIIKF